MRRASTSASSAAPGARSSSPLPPRATTTRRGPEALPLFRLRHPFDPHRQRIDAERVIALAQDIAVNGLLQPIGVRGPAADGSYEICYGDRRVYAHEHLKRESIDGYIYPLDTDPLDIRASENLFHESLDPMEEARIARRFLDGGMALVHVAAKMGHATAWVEARVALLGYPADLQVAIATGALPLAVAAGLAGITHAGVRENYITEALRTGASARTVSVWLAHWQADGARMAANHETVERIIAEREHYTIHVQCEGCQKSVDLMQTRSLRFCMDCVNEIKAAAGAP